MPRRLPLAAVIALLTVADFANAHDRTTSFSSWSVSGGQGRVTLTMSAADVAALPLAAGDSALAQYAQSHLALLAAGKPCELRAPPRQMATAPGRIRLEWSVAAPGGELEIRSELFREIYPGHLHFANLQRADGAAARVLTSSDKSWRFEADDGVIAREPASTRFRDYLLMGIEHIATGYDHLVFLFALLLAGGTFRTIVKVVSGFTVGHSITLALASLNVVRPQREPIEALIGLSIALVAVENVWLLARERRLMPVATISLLAVLGLCACAGFGRIPALCWLGLVVFLASYYPLLQRGSGTESARWAIALIFGLIHGFGFASVLQEAELPRDRLAGALVGFNLGVEAGQIVLVALAWPLLRWIWMRWRVGLIEVGSACALCLGVYWMVGRNYG